MFISLRPFRQSLPFMYFWVFLLAIIPIILWILPGNFFDGDGVIVCPSRLFFDIECFGCGITRAVQHFHNFQFEDAIYFNSLVVLVYPGLVFTWFMWMRGGLKIIKTVQERQQATIS